MLKFAIVVVSVFFAQHCSAGVKHMGSKVDMHELDKLVQESNNQELIEEIGDVKILHEKSVSLREGFFIAEADALDKRIHTKVCTKDIDFVSVLASCCFYIVFVHIIYTYIISWRKSMPRPPDLLKEMRMRSEMNCEWKC